MPCRFEDLSPTHLEPPLEATPATLGLSTKPSDQHCEAEFLWEVGPGPSQHCPNRNKENTCKFIGKHGNAKVTMENSMVVSIT